VQDRAITEDDYEILLKNKFNDIQAVSVFGGEELYPPQYGRVVVAVDVNNTDGISESTRQKIRTFLQDKSAIGSDPVVTTAKFMYAEVVSEVMYNVNVTSKSRGDIENLVRNAISDYSYNNLQNFKRKIRYSRLVNDIDDADASILSNDTTVRPVILLQPILNDETFFSLQYGNELKPDTTYSLSTIDLYEPCISSTLFTFNGDKVSLMDNGSGDIYMISTKNGKRTVISSNAGKVDYAKGDVRLDSLTITAYDGVGIKVYAKTKGKNITAPKNRIISINNRDVRVNVRGIRDD